MFGFGDKKKDPSTASKRDFDTSFDSDLDNNDSWLDDIDVDTMGFDSEKDRSPVQFVRDVTADLSNAGKNAGKGAVSGIASRLEEAFPDVRDSKYMITDFASEAVNLKNDTVQKLKPMLNETKSAAKQLLTSTQNFLPAWTPDFIKKGVGKLNDAVTTDDSAEDDQPSKESNRKREMSNALKFIGAQAAMQNDREKRADVRNAVNNRMAQTRHEETTSVLADIRNQAVFSTSFIRGTVTAYMRKDLELKYRQMYLLEDILEVGRIHSQMAEKKLDAIRHNTALPEYDKITMTEIGKKKLTETMLSGLSGSIGNYGKRFLKNIKSNYIDPLISAAGMGGTLMSGIAQSMDMMAMNREMGMEHGTALHTPLGIAGGWLGKHIGRKLGAYADKNMSPEAKKVLTNIFKMGPQGIALYLDDIKNGRRENVPEILKEGWLADLLRNNLPDIDRSLGRVDNEVLQDPKAAGVITAKFVTTVETIIPGYLSLQTQYLEQLAKKLAGDVKVERKTYDFEKGTFITHSALRDRIHQKMYGTKEERTAIMKANTNELRTIAGGKGEIKQKAFNEVEKDISRYMLNAAQTKILPDHTCNMDVFRAVAKDGLEGLNNVPAADSSVREAREKCWKGIKDPKQVAATLVSFLTDVDGHTDEPTLTAIWTRVSWLMKNVVDRHRSEFLKNLNLYGIEGMGDLVKAEGGDISVSEDAYDKIYDDVTAKELSEIDNEKYDPETGFARTYEKETEVDKAKRAVENVKSIFKGISGGVVKVADAAADKMGFSKEWHDLKEMTAKAFNNFCNIVFRERIKDLKRIASNIFHSAESFIYKWMSENPSKAVKDLRNAIFDENGHVRKRVPTRNFCNVLLNTSGVYKFLHYVCLNAERNPFYWVLKSFFPKAARIIGELTEEEYTSIRDAENPMAKLTEIVGKDALDDKVEVEEQPVAPEDNDPNAVPTSGTDEYGVGLTYGGSEPVGTVTEATKTGSGNVIGEVQGIAETAVPANNSPAAMDAFVQAAEMKIPETIRSESAMSEMAQTMTNPTLNTTSTLATATNTDQAKSTSNSKDVKPDKGKSYFAEGGTTDAGGDIVKKPGFFSNLANKFFGPEDPGTKLNKIAIQQLTVQKKILNKLNDFGAGKFLSKLAGDLKTIVMAPFKAIYGLGKGAVGLGITGAKAAGRGLTAGAHGAKWAAGHVWDGTKWAADKAWTGAGWAKDKALAGFGWARDKVSGLYHDESLRDKVKNAASRIASAPFGFASGLRRKFVDVGIMTPAGVRILVRADEFRDGLVQYADGSKPKTSYSIKEPLFWTDAPANGEKAGTIAIAAEHIQQGLVDSKGKKVTRLSKLAGAGLRIGGELLAKGASLFGGGVFAAGASLLKHIKTGFSWVKDKLTSKSKNPFRDVFVPGEDGKIDIKNPRLRGELIKTGAYCYDKDGSMLRSAFEIDSAIREVSTKNVLITDEEAAKGVYDVDGNRLTRFAGASILGKMKMFAARAAKKTVGGVVKAAKGVKKWVTDKFKGLGGDGGFFDSFKGKFDGLFGDGLKRGDIEELVTKRLDTIIDILVYGKEHVSPKLAQAKAAEDKKQEEQAKEDAKEKAVEAQEKKEEKKNGPAWLDKLVGKFHDAFGPKKVAGDLDGDGIRDGSYADKQKEKQSKLEALKGKLGMGGAKGGLLAGLTGLFSRFRGGQEEDDGMLDTLSDAATIKDALDGDGRGKDDKTKVPDGKNNVPKKRGLLSKAGDFIKNKVPGGKFLARAGSTVANVASKIPGLGTAGRLLTGAAHVVTKIPLLGGLVSGAGSLLGGAAGALGAIGGAAAAALPVVAGVAAVAAAGYGIYKLASWALGDSDLEVEFAKLRYKAYGLDYEKHHDALEDFEEETADAMFDNDEIDEDEFPDIAEDLGLISDDEDPSIVKKKLKLFSDWFYHRFTVVIAAYARTMRQYLGEDEIEEWDDIDVDDLPEDKIEEVKATFEKNYSQYLKGDALKLVPTKEGFEALANPKKEEAEKQQKAEEKKKDGSVLERAEANAEKDKAKDKDAEKSTDTKDAVTTDTSKKDISDITKPEDPAQQAAVNGPNPASANPNDEISSLASSAAEATAMGTLADRLKKNFTQKELDMIDRAKLTPDEIKQVLESRENGTKLDKNINLKLVAASVTDFADAPEEKEIAELKKMFPDIQLEGDDASEDEKEETEKTTDTEKKDEADMKEQAKKEEKSWFSSLKDKLVDGYKNGLAAAGKMLTSGAEMLKNSGVGGGILGIGLAISNKLKNLISGDSDSSTSIWDTITTKVKDYASAMPSKITSALMDTVPGKIGAGLTSLFGATGDGVPQIDLSNVSAADIPDGGVGDLGSYVQKFESGSRGASAIGYDSTGGTSYGTYQIATKNGTMAKFLKYASSQGGDFGKKLAEAMAKAGNLNTGSKTGTGPSIWKQFAEVDNGQALHKLESGFIKATHYDPAYKQITDPQARALIDSDRGLREALWSTSIQHGPGSASRGNGAAGIFNKTFKKGMTAQEWLQAIYAKRGTQFGSSTAAVQKSVLNRYKQELPIVLGLSKASPAMPGSSPDGNSGAGSASGLGSSEAGVTTGSGVTSSMTGGGSSYASGGGSGSVADSPAAQAASYIKLGGIDPSALKIKDINSFKGLHPLLQQRLTALGQAYESKFGEKLIMTSGKRSLARQQELYDKLGPSQAAKPSPYSPHISGVAVDADSSQLNKAAQNGLLDQFGLWRPLVNGLGRTKREPWHLELVGSRDPKTMRITEETLKGLNAVSVDLNSGSGDASDPAAKDTSASGKDAPSLTEQSKDAQSTTATNTAGSNASTSGSSATGLSASGNPPTSAGSSSSVMTTATTGSGGGTGDMSSAVQTGSPTPAELASSSTNPVAANASTVASAAASSPLTMVSQVETGTAAQSTATPTVESATTDAQQQTLTAIRDSVAAIYDLLKAAVNKVGATDTTNSVSHVSPQPGMAASVSTTSVPTKASGSVGGGVTTLVNDLSVAIVRAFDQLCQPSGSLAKLFNNSSVAAGSSSRSSSGMTQAGGTVRPAIDVRKRALA